jgi:hypothetical protein
MKIGLSLTELAFYPEAESAPCGYMSKQLGKGDVIPPMYVSELSEGRHDKGF